MTAAPTPSPPISPTWDESGGASRPAGLLESAMSILNRKSNRPVARPTGGLCDQEQLAGHVDNLGSHRCAAWRVQDRRGARSRQVADRDVGDLGRAKCSAGPDRRRRSASQAPNAICDGFDLDLSAPNGTRPAPRVTFLSTSAIALGGLRRLTTENGTPRRSPFPGSSTRSDDAGRGRVAHALRGSGKTGRAACAARPALPRPCRSRLHARCRAPTAPSAGNLNESQGCVAIR